MSFCVYWYGRQEVGLVRRARRAWPCFMSIDVGGIGTASFKVLLAARER